MCRTMLKVTFGLLGLMLYAAQGESAIGADKDRAASELGRRSWTDASGSYRIQAVMVGTRGGDVFLKKENGVTIKVPIGQLSKEDQAYLKSLGHTRQQPGRTSELGHDSLPSKSGDESDSSADSNLPKERSKGATAVGISELEEKCQQVCEELTKTYKGANPATKPTIAVVEFSDLSGGVTDVGRFISEELITKLVATGNYKVIERLLLNKAIAEHKLRLQGIVDPKSAKELGKILGVDAIVSGTIADRGDSSRVNARLISTETGEVLSAAAVTVRRDKEAAVGGGQKEERATDDRQRPEGKIRLPYREDFADYKDDAQNTAWGRHGRVKTGADGRKWLIPSGNGQKTIGLEVELPDDAYIDFDYYAEALDIGGTDEQRASPGKIISGISLIDEAGTKLRIDWVVQPSRGARAVHVMSLPGGSSINPSGSNTGTVRIRKEGHRITIALESRELSRNVGDFKGFRRFEIDLNKTRNTMIAVTNIKIGKLQ